MLVPLQADLFVCAVPHRAIGLQIGRQLVVVRLPSGGLWIHSPIPWTPALRGEIARLGPVRHVIGPNRIHDAYLRELQAEYPDAEFHAAPGLTGDRPDTRFVAQPLSDEPHADWAAVMDQRLVRGMPRLNEVVFHHRASRTLILADLAFNVGPPGPWFTALVMRLNNAWGRFTPSRVCKSLMQDRAAVRASLDHILTWDFDRVLVGHGANIGAGGKDAFRAAFAFLG